MSEITIHLKEVNFKNLVSNDKAIRITMDCVDIENDIKEILKLAEFGSEEILKCKIWKN